MSKKWIIAVMVSLGSSIGTWAQKAIDVHCHNIFPSYLQALDKHEARMEEGFPLPLWEVNAHIRWMEKADVECAVLSMPAPQPFFGDTEESIQIVRAYNEASAQLKATYPQYFKFCASLPLPNVEAAIKEAIYALDTLGADGIKLATNSRGQYLGDEELEPLMAVLNERKAVIIIHPHKPVPYEEERMRSVPLAIYEYPAETTRAVVNMITHNVLSRYTNLKVVVPHCGSFLPLALPRMKSVHPIMQANGLMLPIAWEENLSRLYYDLAGGASAEVLQSLLTITSPDHLLYGSDYPYVSAENCERMLSQLRKTLQTHPQLAPYAERILYRNALQLFNGQ